MVGGEGGKPRQSGGPKASWFRKGCQNALRALLKFMVMNLKRDLFQNSWKNTAATFSCWGIGMEKWRVGFNQDHIFPGDCNWGRGGWG